MTNEEKIKAMSTEELAESVDKLIQSCTDCPFFGRCINTKGKNCVELIEDWLKEEA